MILRGNVILGSVEKMAWMGWTQFYHRWKEIMVMRHVLREWSWFCGKGVLDLERFHVILLDCPSISVDYRANAPRIPEISKTVLRGRVERVNYF